MEDSIKLINERSLSTCALAKVGTESYFVDRDSKAIFCYNKELQVAEVKNIVQTIEISNSYWMAFSYEKEVWFIPVRYYEKIAVYNTTDNSIEYIEIPIPVEKARQERRPFEDFFIYNSKVYLIPGYYDCVLEIDLLSKLPNRIDIGIEAYVGQQDEIFSSGIQCENIIYMCPWNLKNIFAFDMETNQVNVIECELAERRYFNICAYNKKLLLIPEKIENGFVIYDLCTGQKEELDFVVDVKATSYRGCAFDKEKNELFMFPYGGKNILAVNFEERKIRNIQVLDDGTNNEYMWGKRKRVAGDILITSESSNTPMVMCRNGEISELSIQPSDDYFISVLLLELEQKNS